MSLAMAPRYCVPTLSPEPRCSGCGGCGFQPGTGAARYASHRWCGLLAAVSINCTHAAFAACGSCSVCGLPGLPGVRNAGCTQVAAAVSITRRGTCCCAAGAGLAAFAASSFVVTVARARRCRPPARLDLEPPLGEQPAELACGGGRPPIFPPGEAGQIVAVQRRRWATSAVLNPW